MDDSCRIDDLVCTYSTEHSAHELDDTRHGQPAVQGLSPIKSADVIGNSTTSMTPGPCHRGMDRSDETPLRDRTWTNHTRARKPGGQIGDSPRTLGSGCLCNSSRIGRDRMP